VTEVVAALIWEGERFLACQRPAHKARGLLWEFVGGKVEPGETKEEALIRECREELGITLAVGESFMEVTHTYPDLTVHLTIFHAQIVEGVPQKLEHNDIRWITIGEMDQLPFCPADVEILDRLRTYDRKADLLKEELFSLLREKGAVLLGVADMTGFVEGPCTTGISVAVPVPRHIVEDLKTAPTLEYLETYHALNAKLDAMVEAGGDFLRERGYQAVANTTKVMPWNRTELRSPLPHKTVATRAGLGWIGKNCLLVTKEYGGAIRISTILTDVPLPVDRPVTESRCGKCTNCVEACPGGALKGTLWKAGMDREELLDSQTCLETQPRIMKEAAGVEADICGKCYAVCPYTQGYLNRKDTP